MGKKMFCFQCQEACRNTGCTLTGMCGKNAETSAVMDKLLRQLKLIALTKKTDRELGRFVIQSLFMTVTNANFDSARLQNQLSKAETMTGTAAVDVPSGVLACADEDIRSLRELLLYGLKGISAYAKHADSGFHFCNTGIAECGCICPVQQRHCFYSNIACFKHHCGKF